MINMRFTENLKKRFIFLLTALVLLQVVPMGAIAQKSASSPKAINQQDSAEPQDEARAGNSWRSKLAPDLEQSVHVVKTGCERDKMSRVIIQLQDKAPGGQSIKRLIE